MLKHSKEMRKKRKPQYYLHKQVHTLLMVFLICREEKFNTCIVNSNSESQRLICDPEMDYLIYT